MTVQDVIDIARRRYPKIDSGRALQLFNETHREFCSRSQVRNKTEVISLTAEVSEYELPAEVALIHEAYFESSADPGDWQSLVERSTDEYAVMRRSWRSISSLSQPLEYYVTSAASGNSSVAQLGLWPAPPVSTSGDYPRVRLYVTSVVELSTSDDLPAQILNSNLYVYGMWAKWLVERQDGSGNELMLYRQLAEGEMERNVQHVKGVQDNSTTQFVPAFTSGQGRVV